MLIFCLTYLFWFLTTQFVYTLFALKFYYNYKETHTRKIKTVITPSLRVCSSMRMFVWTRKCRKTCYSYSHYHRCRTSKKNNSSITELYNNLFTSQMVAADQRAKMSPQRTISLVSTTALLVNSIFYINFKY